jgi:NAD(P)-dependent dehydrogenase (short-subunit alcohol dehydrogenase family)
MHPGLLTYHVHLSVLIPLPGDVTSQHDLQAMAERVRQETGHINLLVANAGMAGPGLRGIGPRAGAAEFACSAWLTPMSEFDSVYNLNCTATYYTILAFLDLLDAGNKRRKPGDPPSQVVATASMVAFQRDPRYGFAYLSSKAALVSMMKSFATFGVSWGIRFNSIAPGCTFRSAHDIPFILVVSLTGACLRRMN